MKKILQINENDISIVGLKEILDLLPSRYHKLHWSLFEIEAVGDLGDDRSMPDFQDEVSDSPKGIPFNWNELSELADKLDDIINFVVAGKKNNDFKKYVDEHSLIRSSDIVIEFFDSCYWRIYSSDKKLLKSVSKLFSDTELLKYPKEF